MVTLTDFDASILNGPISAHNNIDMISISLAYQQASGSTSSPYKEVFLLLAEITSIQLTPAEGGMIWRPHPSANNLRSIIPSDIQGEQSDVLEAILRQIEHPVLRARIADIVWTKDKSKKEISEAAIDAYCDCVEGLINGSLEQAYPTDGRNLSYAQKPAHRALQIASAIKKRKAPLPNRVDKVLRTLYSEALKDGRPVVFSQVADLCVDYKIIEPKQAAPDLETLAPVILPEVIRHVLDLACVFYKEAGNYEGVQRCQLGAVHQILRMRDMRYHASMKADYVKDAILRLRHIKCEEAQVLKNNLEKELRCLQRASLSEMNSITVNIKDLVEQERIVGEFSKLDISAALKSFAELASSPKMEDLKAQVLEQREKYPLNDTWGIKHIDDEGKTVVGTARAEGWSLSMIARIESFRRAFDVANYINPARLQINKIVEIEEQHFTPIVDQSVFVPEPHAPLHTLGFTRFFQGDFRSAAHLLMPQLEPSLRHILEIHGADLTKRHKYELNHRRAW